MLLDRKNFFIKQHARVFKLTNAYDILDPETKQQIGTAKENVGGWNQFLRLWMNKMMMPSKVDIYENGAQTQLFSIHKPFTWWRAKVNVLDSSGNPVGYLKGMIRIGGGFTVHDMQNNKLADIKGDWKGWNFKFTNAKGEEVGTVTKKWAGIGKELFTSADNYMISLNTSNGSAAMSLLLLAAGLSIDIVYKNK